MRTLQKKSGTTGPVADDELQLVTFLVGTEEYGLDIGSITEVIRPLKITPLPRMPQFIEGVVNIRGTIIPIVDLRKRFALATIHDNVRKMRMMITKGAVPPSANDALGLLGLVVDGVHDVLLLRRADIGPAPDAATGAQAGFLKGMGKVGDRLVILLDATRILSRSERSALEEAGNAES